MKANRKFVRRDDEAVSPVIAVILMVAITVVLAATVYVWVSGFSASGSDPAKTIALSSGAAYDSGTNTKKYVVASASPGLKYSDFKMTVDGTDVGTNGNIAATNPCVVTTSGFCWSAGAGSATRLSTDVVTAGDTITIDRLDAEADFNGKALRILDKNSNSVILTLTVA